MLISNLMSVTDDAHAALWRYCFDIDLRTTTEARYRPVDDPLPWMLADPGRLKREVRNALWLRLVDVAQALSGRTYSRDGGLVLGVVDSFCPWNDGTRRTRRGAQAPDAGPRGRDVCPSTPAVVALPFLGGQGGTTRWEVSLTSHRSTARIECSVDATPIRYQGEWLGDRLASLCNLRVTM